MSDGLEEWNAPLQRETQNRHQSDRNKAEGDRNAAQGDRNLAEGDGNVAERDLAEGEAAQVNFNGQAQQRIRRLDLCPGADASDGVPSQRQSVHGFVHSVTWMHSA